MGGQYSLTPHLHTQALRQTKVQIRQNIWEYVAWDRLGVAEELVLRESIYIGK
jgi:hypothetical protein